MLRVGEARPAAGRVQARRSPQQQHHAVTRTMMPRKTPTMIRAVRDDSPSDLPSSGVAAADVCSGSGVGGVPAAGAWFPRRMVAYWVCVLREMVRVT